MLKAPAPNSVIETNPLQNQLNALREIDPSFPVYLFQGEGNAPGIHAQAAESLNRIHARQMKEIAHFRQVTTLSSKQKEMLAKIPTKGGVKELIEVHHLLDEINMDIVLNELPGIKIALDYGLKRTEFILKGKNLTRFPQKLYQNADFKRCWDNADFLIISDNMLDSLPEFISHNEYLLELDCSNNEIKRIPDLNKCIKLQSLRCHHNHLSSLPLLPGSVALIHAQCNKITSIPESYWGCPHLISVDLSYNQIERLPELPFIRPDGLLDCAFNNLRSLPQWFMDYFGGLHVQGLMYQQGQLAYQRQLTEISHFIQATINGDITLSAPLSAQLSRISLQNNSEANFARNRLLDDINCELIRAHVDMEEESLDLDAAYLTRLPDRFFRTSDLHYLSGLRGLFFNFNTICHIPSGIYKCHSLEDLHFTGNAFSYVVLNLALLGRLTSLVCSRNQIRSLLIPTWTNADSKLEELDVSHNCIAKLPQNITQYKHLKRIDFSDNQLMTLSNDVGELVKLEEINVSNNALTVIPQTVGFCTELRIIRAQGNAIVSLPDLTNCPHFDYLNYGKDGMYQPWKNLIAVPQTYTPSFNHGSNNNAQIHTATMQESMDDEQKKDREDLNLRK